MGLGIKESHFRKGLILFVLLSVSVMIGIMFWTTETDTWEQLKKFQLIYIPLLFALSILRWYFDGLFFVTLARHGHKSPLSINRAVVIRLEGTVLAAVLPILVGTFSMHAYLLHKEKLKISESMAITVLRSIIPVFLFLLNIPILIFLKEDAESSRFFTQLIKVLSLPIAVILVFFVITLFYPNQIKRLATAIVRWLGRMKFKHSEERIMALEQRLFHEIDQFSRIFWTYLREKKWVLFQATLCILMAFLVDYLIALAILWGFDYHPSVVRAIAIQFLMRPIIYFALTPGGAGIWEITYLGFFSLFIPHSLTGMAVLIWRLLLTYLPIVIGTFFMIHEFGKDHKLKDFIVENRDEDEDEDEDEANLDNNVSNP
ncbi:flippase-like domain-containing protein [candidate division KSB1 bacterium]|nr:flippase-like domain-containing protein [candidate division KSB1 bacterium]